MLSQIRYSFQQLKKETVLFNLYSIQNSKESLIEHVFNVTKAESTESLNSYSNLIILLDGFGEVEREGFIGEISRLIDAIPDVPIYITATVESLKKWHIPKVFKDFDFISLDKDVKIQTENLQTKLPSSDYELMLKFTSGFIKQGNQFWWLKRPEGLLVDIDAPGGVNYQFKKRNSQGELRKGLDAVKKGDIAFAYRTEEFNVLDGIYIVNGIDKNDDVSFQFIQKLDSQIPWLFIKAQKEFKGSSVVANNAQKTIYQLNISQVNLIFLHGLTNFRLLEKNLLDIGNTATHIPIVLDIRPFSKKNAELVEDTEFYFQKAVDILEKLKKYDNLEDGFVDLKEIKKAASQKKSSYELINTHWENRGKVTPSLFIGYLKEHQPDLIPLYELISKFISYIDRNAWNKNAYNEYSDNRVIAKTGVNQSDLVSHFLDFALNGFVIEPTRIGYVFSNAIEYLKNPSENFNILSKKHIALISKYFLGAIYSGDEFHSKLKNYFEQEYQLSVVNFKNVTCFYTIIIYAPSIRKLWDKDRNDNEEEDIEIRDVNNQIKTPTYNNDNAKGEDLLGIDNDIRSFASLIAHKDIHPPLSIALFGEWGSGKSFFMNKLEDKIKTLSNNQGFQINENNDYSFVKGIAHIKFNAWSYMDSNLWAGLADSLFEKLNEYINNHTKGDLARLKVKVKIHNNIQLLHSKIDGYQIKSEEFKNLKIDLEKQRKYKVLRYFENEYEGDVQTFLEKNGWSEEEIKERTPKELKSAINKSVSFLEYLKSNSNRVLAIICIAVLSGFIFQGVLSQLITNYGWASFNWVKSYLLTISISFTPFVYYLKKYRGDGKKAIVQLNNFIQKLKKPDSNQLLDEKLTTLRDEIEEIDSLIAEVNKTIKSNVSDLDNLTEIAVTDLIKSVNENDEYKKHLGIISTIRKDFETLNSLFSIREEERQEEKAIMDEELPDSMQVDRLEIEKVFEESEKNKLERIVLYIDDLDRCSDEKVVEVLEAVNLLMAFPLFVVVVGVDPRWVNNALLKKYNLHFNGKDTNDSSPKKIEVSDYLEKIFQIPFHLRKPEVEDARNMIDNIFKGEVERARISYPRERFEKTINMTTEEEAYAEIHEYIEEQKEKEKFIEEKLKEFQELTLSIDELTLLKEIVCLIELTPRTIKRFTNIYRIIKGHENLEDKPDSYMIVMFLLAISIGKYKMHFNLLHKQVAYNQEKQLKSIIVSDEKLIPILSEIVGIDNIGKLFFLKGVDIIDYFPLIKRFSFENRVELEFPDNDELRPNLKEIEEIVV